MGDWRSLPNKFAFGGKSYDLAFVNDAAGANNSGMTQNMDSLLGVVQSYFGDDRLVTTLGYRQDKVEVIQHGYYTDPVLGDVDSVSSARFAHTAGVDALATTLSGYT